MNSPLTLLRSRTMYGRPPFEQIFQSLTQSIEQGQYLPGREATLKTRLGVYFCGVRLPLPPTPVPSYVRQYGWIRPVG
jgi:hypothetical protein